MSWKSTQNSDGGWAYHRGGSWTEPTVLVLTAQLAAGIQDSFQSGLGFLRAAARQDGGFRPNPDVDESTWVTSLAALLPPEVLGSELHGRAIAWLKRQTGEETSRTAGFFGRVSGRSGAAGWPWFPGASAWVVPTSFAILAFERTIQRQDESALRRRVEEGRKFLLSKMCSDGGWNYGTPQALGRDADSYPETTGIALLALNGASGEPQLARAKECAARQLSTCRTAEGIAWLSLGLASHGIRTVPSVQPPQRTTSDRALMALAAAPKNPFLTA